MKIRCSKSNCTILYCHDLGNSFCSAFTDLVASFVPPSPDSYRNYQFAAAYRRGTIIANDECIFAGTTGVQLRKPALPLYDLKQAYKTNMNF